MRRKGFYNLADGGISAADKQALIDIANAAESNNSTIKTDIITKLNAKELSIAGEAAWAEIQAAIPGIILGKKFATGTSAASTQTLSVVGLTFQPSIIIVDKSSGDVNGRCVYWSTGASAANCNPTSYSYGAIIAQQDWTVGASNFSRNMVAAATYSWLAIE